MNASYIANITNIDKEVVVETEFQNIREELDYNYYKYGNGTYDDRLEALKNAIDELLTLLDKAVS